MPLPQDFIMQLHDRNEIVDLIGSYVQIRKRGRVYTGLCPFHNEKTPSFTVYPDTQSFYCFGCGTGGDAITFVKLRENLEYIEAVKLLAARAGMTMPEDADDGRGNLRKRVLEANKLAARFFFDSLNAESGKQARAYLRRRKLSDAVIKKFGLGYAPESWDALKNHLNEKGFKNTELVEAGLCTVNQAGTSTYDFFRDRVMFPVIDVRGNVVAFSGRTLSAQDSRKYVNTRDTVAFKKSRTLYALNVAKNSDSRRIIVAEGQMDVIAIHQAGIDCAVAALGTALTDEHVRMISQYADEVVLAYDGDEAGQRATKRAIETFKNSNLLIKVITYEGGKDPDEYIQKHGAESFRELIEHSGNSVEYELGRARLQADLESDGGRVQYLRACAEILARNPSPTERDLYAGRVAETAGVTKQALLLQIDQIRGRTRYKQRKEADRRFVSSVGDRYGTKPYEAGKLGAVSAERRLVALLFYNPDLCDPIRQQVEPSDFSSEETAGIYSALVDTIRNERFAGVTSLSQDLGAAQLSVLSGVLAENSGINFTPEDADYLIDKILKPHSVPDDAAIREMEADELKKLIEKKTKSENGVS